jgi:hypothetical protein
LLWALLLAPWEALWSGVHGQALWRFTEVTGESGLTSAHAYQAARPSLAQNAAGGVAAGDYDGDGHVDLYVIGGDAAPNRLFRNRGDGTFVDVAAQAGVALEGISGSGPLFFDFDGDGRLDLFVGAVDGGPPTLFHNEGDGTFRDVTADSGLSPPSADPPPNTLSATAADYDGDGWLDLFLSHWETPGEPCHLWHNLGNGQFQCADAAAGLVHLFPDGVDLTFTGNFVDIDGDGALDLLITADFHHSTIWRNRGDGTFQNLTATVLTDENGMGSAIGDYDGDGHLDWFVSSVFDGDGVTEGNWGTTGNRMYRSHGDGSFEDATTAAGVRDANWGWGASFADFDNDGRLDLVVVNGWPQGSAQFRDSPSRLFIAAPLAAPSGGGRFEDKAAALGFADSGDGRGVVSFDYDGDGDLDIFVANNNGPYRLYRNDGGRAAGHFLGVSLRAPAPNVFAVGALIRVTAGGHTQVREVRDGTNYASQDPFDAHFGLGSATRVDRVEVTWPGGAHTVLNGVAPDQVLVITPDGASGDIQLANRGGCSGC